MNAEKTQLELLSIGEVMRFATIVFLGTLVATGLTGCASNPTVSSLTSAERQRIVELPVVKVSRLPHGSYRIIGSVEGIACKRNLYASGAPSMDEAKQGAKIRAVQLGADAIANMVCEDKQEVDWAHNCWQTILCVADAIAISDKALLPGAREEEDQR